MLAAEAQYRQRVCAFAQAAAQRNRMLQLVERALEAVRHECAGRAAAGLGGMALLDLGKLQRRGFVMTPEEAWDQGFCLSWINEATIRDLL